MSFLIDLVGSAVIGGLIMLMMVGYNYNIGSTAASQCFTSNVQTDLTSITEVLEYDLRKLGYRVSDSIKVMTADTTKIIFKADIDNNGTVDVIKYFLGDGRPKGVSNPRARNFFRVLNSQTSQPINAGITKFRLWYYDAEGNPTTLLSRIRSIKVAVNIESPSPIDSLYTGTYWERTFRPKNLR